MKVLLIDVNCKNSSTGKIVYDLYSYLNDRGDEAAICYGRGQLVKESNIFKFGLDWETYLHALLTRISGFTGCFSFFSTRRLIKYIETFNPDVVHIHELHAYFVNISPLLEYLAKKNIKVIHTLHCEFSYTGKCGHSVDCEQWKVGCVHCQRLHDYVSTRFFDHTSYMYNKKKKSFQQIKHLYLTTPSYWLFNRLGESFLKNYPRCVVHNGVDTDIFRPVNAESLRNKLAISNDQRIILALAPNLMTAEKGGYFIKKIAADMMADGFQFIMVGVDGETMHRENNIWVCGRIYDKELLAQYYSLADAFLICSERENYPTTCLEAQACGTPVYGFSTGGTEETILQNKSNLVAYGETEQLEKLLLGVNKKNNVEIKRLRQLAVETISKDKSMRDYYSIYEEIMK